MNEIVKRSLSQHRKSLDKGEYSSQELTRAYLDEIDRREPDVGAFLTLDATRALSLAAEADKRIAKHEIHGDLDGIPYAVKDNFCTAGMRTTCASRMLEHFVPPYDATAVAKLNEAGAILLGKLNMDEFAMGSATETSALGVTRNPLNTAYVPGGSSGGSAAAVAAYEAPFTLGSDTGGSVRQPAAFCGVLGMKPTWGAVSRYGMIAMSSSLDCVGILTHTAADCGIVLGALCGNDPMDATSRTHPDTDFSVHRSVKNGKLHVAVVRELIADGEVSPAVIAATEQAIACFEKNGAEIGEVSLPSPEAALSAYCVISAAEASSNLARYDGVAFGARSEREDDIYALYANSRSEHFGSEVKRRILFGTYMLSESKRGLYYDRARVARSHIAQRMREILETYDLILTPTTPTAAFLRGSALSPTQRRRADLCAVYASLAGIPALSVPFGNDENGMPLGVQLAAAPFCEGLLLRAANLLELERSHEATCLKEAGC